MESTTYSKLVNIAKNNGFNIDKLVKINQNYKV